MKRTHVDVAARTAVAGYDVVRWLLAALLSVAAGLKGHQLVSQPLPPRGLLHSRWLLIGIVVGELGFALWLLMGTRPRLSWLAAVLAFGAFAWVSVYKGLTGESTCGCFGRVPVNPWYTVALDMGVVAALVAFPPRQTTASSGWRLPGWMAVLIAVGIGLPGSWAMMSFEPGTIGADGTIGGEGSLVVLLPEEWQGKALPVLAHIDIGEHLARGKWLVLFYHLGCPRCEKLIDGFRESGRGSGADSGAPCVAMIEVPELGREAADDPEIDTSECLLGKLSQSKEWFMSTPAILALEDGIVREVVEDASADRFFAMLNEIRGANRL